MLKKLEKTFALRLQKRRQDNLYRTRTVSIANELLSFSSNDYLGLANHPEVVSAGKKGLDKYGVGSGASQLLGGYSHAHQALEEELADFLSYERALVFSTGYMTNLGVITALFGAGDHVFMDRLSHASLIDGARYCGARHQRYQHGNVQHLQKLLAKTAATNKLISSDGIFSMDGDLAPIPELIAIAQQHQSWLMIDDAHGIGVLGDKGKGTLNYYGAIPQKDVQILVGTFGKAFGTFGAFVAGSKSLIENLIQFSRPYIYTTALPAMIAEATRASLKILQQEEWRRFHLSILIKRFQHGAQQLGLPLLLSTTPIQPLIIGEAAQAQKIALQLKRHSILVGLIRPPTVPVNTARLRITLTANHTEKQIDYLLENISATICSRGL